MVDVDAMNSELDQISDQYQSLFRRLNSESPRDVQTVALSLSIALSQLYQLAIFVRGDYNQRAFDVSPERDSLVAKVKEAFEQLAHASMTALEHVSTLQSEVWLRPRGYKNRFTDKMDLECRPLVLKDARISTTRQSSAWGDDCKGCWLQGCGK
jgi:hypothetical protein